MFLPLDSWIFQSEIIFPNENLSELKLKRRFSFGDIRSKNHYVLIQEYLKQRVSSLDVKYEIFLDLFWNNRYQRDGNNLFELNPD